MKKLATLILVYTIVTSTRVPLGEGGHGKSVDSDCHNPVCQVSLVYDANGNLVAKCMDQVQACQALVDSANGN